MCRGHEKRQLSLPQNGQWGGRVFRPYLWAITYAKEKPFWINGPKAALHNSWISRRIIVTAGCNEAARGDAWSMAAHESPRTTKLYDRTSDEITLDEVERIAI
jgi:hypothetical protein